MKKRVPNAAPLPNEFNEETSKDIRDDVDVFFEGQASIKAFCVNHACEFAEWLYNNRWYYFNNGIWNYTFEHGTAISKQSYDKNYRKTTSELYDKFCQSKGY